VSLSLVVGPVAVGLVVVELVVDGALFGSPLWLAPTDAANDLI
jgi:hypothetical protein